MFYIEWYKNGKTKRKYFETLEDAKKVVKEVFEKTGIIMGIQKKEIEHE